MGRFEDYYLIKLRLGDIMGFRLFIALLLSTPYVCTATVTELSDGQLSTINGKGNGLVTPPIIIPPKTGCGLGGINCVKFPKYSTLNITATSTFKAPLEGFDSMPAGDNFKGIHYINLVHNFGVDSDYRNYVIHSQNFDNGIKTITDSGNGAKYSVIGDVWRASKSTDGEFNMASNTVVEEYYRVMNTDGTASNKALRWTSWNRDINMTKW